MRNKNFVLFISVFWTLWTATAALGTTPIPCTTRALTAKETNYDEKLEAPKQRVEEMAPIDIDHPAFSMHKDDFIQHEPIQIAANCTKCTITLIVSEIVPFEEISNDATKANPIFPFLIDKKPAKLQCYLDTLFYDEGETTYTLTITNLPFHFILSLADKWKGENSPYFNYTFGFTAYVPEMIDGDPPIYTIPLQSNRMKANSVIFNYNQLNELAYYVMVAAEDQHIVTETFRPMAYNLREHNEDCMVDVFTGSIPNINDTSSLIFSRSVNRFYDGQSLDWRSSIITYRFSKGPAICQGQIEHKAYDLNGNYSNLETGKTNIFWIDQNSKYPDFSKDEKQGIRAFFEIIEDLDLTAMPWIMIDIVEMSGGSLDLLIERPDFLWNVSVQEQMKCQAQGALIKYAWTPDDDAEIESRFSVYFQAGDPVFNLTDCFIIPTDIEEVNKKGKSPKWVFFVLPIPVLIAFLILYCSYRRWKNNRILKRNSEKRKKKMNSLQKFIQRSLKAKEIDEPVDPWEISMPLLEIGEKIGSGKSANVYKGMLKGQIPCTLVDSNLTILFPISTAGFEVVIKMPRVEEEKAMILAEISLLKSIGYHPQLLSLLGCFTNSKNPLLITNFCEHGDLLTLLKGMENDVDFYEELTPSDFPSIIWQIANGMSFLASTGVIHRELAAKNVLITGNKSAKICNFGKARQGEQTGGAQGNFPIKWTSPEAIENRSFSEKSDVWSFGILLWEVYTFGKDPYTEVKISDLLQMLKDGHRLKPPRETPEAILDLMSSCWKSDPEERPEFTKIAQHLFRFFQKKTRNAFDQNLGLPTQSSQKRGPKYVNIPGASDADKNLRL